MFFCCFLKEKKNKKDSKLANKHAICIAEINFYINIHLEQNEPDSKSRVVLSKENEEKKKNILRTK